MEVKAKVDRINANVIMAMIMMFTVVKVVTIPLTTTRNSFYQMGWTVMGTNAWSASMHSV